MRGNLARGLDTHVSTAINRIGTMKRAERSSRRKLHDFAFHAGQQAQKATPRLVKVEKALTVTSLAQFLASTPVLDPVSVEVLPRTSFDARQQAGERL